MDFSNANTEPFYHFYRFHEHLNRSVKMLAASLQHTKGYLLGSENPKKVFSTLVSECDARWEGSHEWPDLEGEFHVAEQMAAEMHIVRVDSAFGAFITELEAENFRHIHSTSAVVRAQTEKEITSLVRRACVKLGFNPASIMQFSPIWDFFHELRNCIVHRNGMPTSTLVEMSSRDSNLKLLHQWPSSSSKRPNLRLPSIHSNKIAIGSCDAILYSDCCLKIASILNAKMREKLQVDGIILMAAQHIFFGETPLFKSRKFKTPEAALCWFLSERYRVDKIVPKEAILLAKRVGCWSDCRACFFKT